MRKLISAAVAAIALAWAGSAAAAAPACKDTGSATANALSFDGVGEDVTSGLEVSLVLGLEPESFPRADIAKARKACRRGDFDLNGERFEIFGDDKDTPPRWAIGSKGRIAYLALIPDPIQAHQWMLAREKDPNAQPSFTTMLYALTVVQGDKRVVYAIYRRPPDDYRLSHAFQAALGGRWKPVAVLNAPDGQVDLSGLANAGHQEAAISDPGQARLSPPDGVFVRDQDGSLRHPPSGLVCPARIGRHPLADVTVIDPSQGGRDVFCRFFTETSWVSVFATRMEGRSLPDVFEMYRREATGQSPIARELPAPLDIATSETFSLFWKARDGSNQGLVVVRRGDWYFELRITYADGAEKDVAAFLSEALRLIDANAPNPSA